jgi:SAM-dependent methyltransferase
MNPGPRTSAPESRPDSGGAPGPGGAPDPGSTTDRGSLSDAGLWQLVESDGYRVDLDAWAELAATAGGPVLDIGCGIGRVSHHLNRLGHETTGIDSDAELVADFNRTRPAGSPPALALDATRLLADGSPLSGQRFALVIAPQQLLQIIGGRTGRRMLFAELPRLLAPGGKAAFAICEELPRAPVDYPGVASDIREVEGWVHASRPVSIEAEDGSVTAARLRRSLSPDGQVDESTDTVTLDRLDRTQLEAELVDAGLTPIHSRPISETDRHMGSTLVVARPATS